VADKFLSVKLFELLHSFRYCVCIFYCVYLFYIFYEEKLFGFYCWRMVYNFTYEMNLNCKKCLAVDHNDVII